MSGFPRCEFVVEAHFRGKRIDTFLEKHLRNYTPYQIHRLLRAGCVIANDTPIDTLYRVKTRDQVRVHLICPPDRTTVAEPLPLDVIYEDAWLLIVNKPPGMMSHPGGDYQKSTLLNAVQFHLDHQTRWRGLLKPGIVHRISSVLRELGVNIESLETRLESAAFAGSPVFTMDMRVTVPPHLTVRSLRKRVDAACESIMVFARQSRSSYLRSPVLRIIGGKLVWVVVCSMFKYRLCTVLASS